MKQILNNEILRLGLTLMIIGLLASLALALTNQFTEKKIQEQLELQLQNSLKKVMPEQIKPPATHQVLTRKAHDLTHFLPMPCPETMYLAVLAGRFRIKGALETPHDGVLEKLVALQTN